MKRNWILSFNKVLMYSVAALLAATSAYSIPKEPCAPKHDVCCDEPVPGPFAFSYPKDIGLSCPRDFYVHGDFLLMKGTEDGLDYAVSQTHSNHGDTFPLTGGDVKGFSTGSHDWDWDYGFRVGFGFYSNHDQWNFDAKWTYIRINNDTSSSIEGTGTLLPLWLGPQSMAADNATLKNASARWTGDFNCLDLRIGKPYHVSRYFISNPHMGIRAAWIDQDYLARYGLDNGTIGGAQMVAKNNYWGVGLRAGIDMNYLLGAGWYLFGNAGGSILFGKYDVSQETDSNTYNYNIENDFYTNSPNIDLALGICWSKFFSKNKYQVSVQVGYEFQEWFDQNNMRRFYDSWAQSVNGSPIANETVSRGNLAFNGFRFRLNFEF